MLVEFRFKNFLSFRDECVFSMVASKDKTLLEENTAPTEMFGERRLLRTAVVYGANASGKTNLIKALQLAKTMIQDSVEHKGVSKPTLPFMLDDTSFKEPSEFEVTFIEQGVRYQYGFVLDDEKVHEEWLYAFPRGQAQKWFIRSTNQAGDQEWEWGPHLKGEKKRLAEITRPDALFLSVAARFNQRQLLPVYYWFDDQFRTITAYRFPGVFTVERINEDAQFRLQVDRLLQMADLGISEVTIQEEEILETDENSPEGSQVRKGLKSYFVHRVPLEPDGLPFPPGFESEGTRRVFALAIALIDTLEDGMTLAVDELDSSLHPMLVKSLVEMFHDPELNKNNAQLIFNTHDTTLLSSDLFRRDQVWFTEKDEDGASVLYSLLEFKPRKSEALEKGYLQGRYGAVPILTGYPDLLVGE